MIVGGTGSTQVREGEEHRRVWQIYMYAGSFGQIVHRVRAVQ